MPIVTIEARPPQDEKVIPIMLKETQRVGAQTLDCSEGNIWTLYKPLTPGSFVGPQEFPVIVTVKALTGRPLEKRTAFVRELIAVVAKAFQKPSEAVWVHYQEMNPVDVWFENSWTN